MKKWTRVEWVFWIGFYGVLLMLLFVIVTYRMNTCVGADRPWWC